MARAKKEAVSVQLVEMPGTVDIATLPNLFSGVYGRAVYIRMLQEALNRKGFRCPVTGEFDNATVRAVQRMQVTNKLLPNARVGLEEWTALTR